MARKALIEFRRGTAAAWTSANPTLAAGEPGYETNTGKVKIGDGSTAWNSLGYIGPAAAAPVSSVFSRTGAVVAAANDYDYSQIANSSHAIAVSNIAAGSAGQVLGGTGPAYDYPPGYEFDYAEITGAVTITATTDGNSQGTAVIDGNAVTYDGSTRVKIEFYAPYVSVLTSNQNIVVNLYDGTTDLGRLSNIDAITGTNTQVNTVFAARFLTPTAAAHTYHIRAWKTTSGTTAVVGAGAGGASAYMPAYYRITKA